MGSGAAIVMPKLGLTMTEGLLASWRVQPGDTVRPGDVLFVVETEKIANEVEAQAEGRIETIEVAEGATVPVGAVVATWTGPSSSAEAALPQVEAPASVSARPTPFQDLGPQPRNGTRILATPLARRLARQNKIGLQGIRGSGPNGRIKAADVEAALRQASQARKVVEAPAPHLAGSRRPASNVEKIVARRLAAAKQTIPHFYIFAEANVSQLLRVREELNSEGPIRISVNHFVVAAVGRALARMPEVNAVWDHEEIVSLAGTDVGIAVDTDRGLMVPVLRQAGSIGLDALAASAADLVERTRAGRIQPADLEGGAISVSNVGMFGASHLAPIINPGQSAILGVGAMKPVFRPDAAGAPVLKSELGLVMSCDHRIFDGVRAARFLGLVTQFLERPSLLLRG